MIKQLVVGAAILLSSGSLFSDCDGDKGSSPATQPRREEKADPPHCHPEFRMFRISNREYRCTLDGDSPPTDFMFSGCPDGWKTRDIVTRQDKHFTVVIRYECFDD